MYKACETTGTNVANQSSNPTNPRLPTYQYSAINKSRLCEQYKRILHSRSVPRDAQKRLDVPSMDPRLAPLVLDENENQPLY